MDILFVRLVKSNIYINFITKHTFICFIRNSIQILPIYFFFTKFQSREPLKVEWRSQSRNKQYGVWYEWKRIVIGSADYQSKRENNNGLMNCLRNIKYLFLILSLSILSIAIFLKTFSLLTCSLYDILNILQYNIFVLPEVSSSSAVRKLSNINPSNRRINNVIQYTFLCLQ